MKNYLHIGFALLLSAIIGIEAIGFYITKDICEPCGNSSIMVDILKPITIEQNAQGEHCCTPAHDHSSCDHDSTCEHNSKQHDHHQENYYMTHSPDFFERTEVHKLQAQVLAVLLPLIAQDYDHNDRSKCPPDLSETLPTSKDNYRALLCTYLI